MVEQILLAVIKVLGALLRRLPARLAFQIGRGLAFLASPFISRRRIAYANLKAVFGMRYSSRERKKIVFQNLEHLTQNFVEVLRFPVMDEAYRNRYVEICSLNHFEQLRDGKRGGILITPHFGNWELTQIIAALLGEPIHVVARRQKHSQLDEYLNQIRMSHGSVTIHKGGAAREVVRILGEGSLVGALGDLSGGKDGMRVRFFGRKTTAPSGIYSIARQEGVPLLPVFAIREHGFHHKIFVEEPFFVKTGGASEQVDVQETIQNYYGLLEKWITKYPDQWLWFYKRWKYSLTRHILILRDGKKGHESQTEALEEEVKRFMAASGSDYEISFERVNVEFKSAWHQKLFFIFAFFFFPFAQGHLHVLDFFLKPACSKLLKEHYADIILSAGSSLAPLNLLLKQENMAKSVVVMSPPVPYRGSFFDLAIVPEHDQAKRAAKTVVETLIAPGGVPDSIFLKASEQFKKEFSLVDGKERISVFIGGKSKAYQINPNKLRLLLRELKDFAAASNMELLVTTSRRTSDVLSSVVKDELKGHALCRVLIVANEQNFENAVYGMLALSHLVVVTEDSISMISDAVRVRKPVIVVRVGNGKLARKHRRFQKFLFKKSLIQTADEFNFCCQAEANSHFPRQENNWSESLEIQKSFAGIL